MELTHSERMMIRLALEQRMKDFQHREERYGEGWDGDTAKKYEGLLKKFQTK